MQLEWQPWNCHWCLISLKVPHSFSSFRMKMAFRSYNFLVISPKLHKTQELGKVYCSLLFFQQGKRDQPDTHRQNIYMICGITVLWTSWQVTNLIQWNFLLVVISRLLQVVSLVFSELFGFKLSPALNMASGKGFWQLQSTTH